MKDRIAEWDYHHREQGLGALSGCSFEETVDFLVLYDLLERSTNILEIGVGLGYVVRGFYNRGYKVSAFDISNVGLDRVRDMCEKTYDFSNIETMPASYFDLIICHNVVQHIPTPYLYYELFYFIRSLKQGGVMAVKSVSTNLAEDTGDDEAIVLGGIKCADSIGCFCRSIGKFRKIVDRCGGTAWLVSNEPINVDIITGQQVYHITKKMLV